MHRIIPFLAVILLAIPTTAQESAPQPADLGEVNQLVKESKYEEAEKLLASLQADHPDDGALLLLRGELLLALGRPDEARAVLEHGAAVDPGRPRMNFQLGTALASKGQKKPALAAFGKELEINEDEAVRTLAHLNRSVLLEEERRWIEAAAELEAVLTIQPQRGEIYGDLAALYIQAGVTEKAVSTLERGAREGFNSGLHYYSLGARLYKDGRYEDAVAMLGKAVEIDPMLAEAERSLAASLEKLGRDEEAREHLRRYLEINPNAPDAEAISRKLGPSRQ
jgi:tetratricopeptide (TPR) repeat protein